MIARKKKKLIIISSIVVVLLITIGILIYLYLTTDLFKSNDFLFAKYIGQDIDIVNNMFNRDYMKEANEIIQNNKYTSSIEAKINYEQNEETQYAINNLKLINMDASDLDKVFKKEIDTIYITFPEPWPKAHDEKRRLTHVNYLKLYDRVFRKNKHIILKTDNKGYFSYSLMSLSQYWYTFDRVSLDLHHEEKPIVNVLTNYEKQYQKEGRPIYYLDATFEN